MDPRTGPVVIAPGVNGSGPTHWQSRWQPEMTSAVRTAPASWDDPEPEDWIAAVGGAVNRASDAADGSPVLVVAHSLGCRAAVLWAARAPERVAGLFCVAPPDAAGMARAGVAGFDSADRAVPGVPVLLVTSRDDPHTTVESSRALAAAWGADTIELDGLGHINASSDLGAWTQGWDLLTAFAATV